MGKEWLYWAGAGAGKSTKNGGSGGHKQAADSASTGCMTAVFQFFDFHHFPLHRQVEVPPFTPPPSLPQKPTIFKGIEAPRNSLEMDKPYLPSTKKMEDPLHIPMDIQIKTRVDIVRSTTDHPSSSPDYCSSPAAKTPTLVARLMGLDLLPDSSSTCFSGRSISAKPPLKSHLKAQELYKDRDSIRIRSLPESPRISSARKSDSDRRLSLQISKENNNEFGELEFSGYSGIKAGRRREMRDEDEVRARVKQVKESVGRKFGVEITNRVRNREREREEDDDDRVVLLKAKNPSKVWKEESPNKHSMKVLEKERENQRILKNECEKNHQGLKKINRRGCDAIKNKQEEQFVRSRGELPDKKCKRKPLSTEFVMIKKEPFLSPSTKLPQNKVSDAISSKSITQLSSCSSNKYNQAAADKSIVQETTSETSSNGYSSTICGGAEFKYITDILLQTGLDINTPTLFTKWSSLSLPLHPSTFDHLELSHSNFSHQSNRKLIFQLVDEILEDIFKPYTKFKPWVFPIINDYEIFGSELSEKLCKKIQSFPMANCQVLEDIDALIDVDLRKMKLQRSMEFEEEGEGIVEEIGVELLDNLVHEIAIEIF